MDWVLAQDSNGELLLKNHKSSGGFKSRRVYTSKKVASILKRSHRQIYRYVKSAVLATYGKFLGDWLFDAQEVDRMKYLPKTLRKLPNRFQILFPEYSLEQLNPYKQWRIILSRVLDQGGRAEVSWILRRYPKEFIKDFIREEGWRLLSPKSLNFWGLYFEIKPRGYPSWRVKGRSWGGVSS